MTKKRTHTTTTPAALSFASSTASLDRRLFIKGAALGVVGSAVFGWFAHTAYGAKASDETLNALSSAQAQYEAAMAELSNIGSQLEQAQYQLNECQANLASTDQQIADLEASIIQNQAELSNAQDVLAERVNASYRAGNADLLGVLLDATSFDDFVSRLYYAGKVSEADAEAIQRVKDIKAELESQEQQLQEQRAYQEQLLADQQAYTDELAGTVAYYEQYTASLSSKVTALMNQAQQELIASQQAEYEAYLAQQQAAANAAASENGSSSSSGASSANPEPSNPGESSGSNEPSPAPAPVYPEPAPEPEPEPVYPDPEPEPVYPDPDPEPEPVYPDPEPSYSGGNHVYAVADIAWNYIGVPYVWGGTTPDGFDCSGLAQYCYSQAGYYIGRTTYDQAANISARGQMTYSMGNLQPGDLVFPHDGHVGIYEGGGMMIHAPSPGEFVKYASVYAFSFGGCPV